MKMVFAVCMSGGGRMSEKAASLSVVNCVQFAFLYFVNMCLLCCSLYWVCVDCRDYGRWSEFSACFVCQVVWLYSVVEIVACCSVVCDTLVGLLVFSVLSC